MPEHNGETSSEQHAERSSQGEFADRTQRALRLLERYRAQGYIEQEAFEQAQLTLIDSLAPERRKRIEAAKTEFETLEREHATELTRLRLEGEQLFSMSYDMQGTQSPYADPIRQSAIRIFQRHEALETRFTAALVLGRQEMWHDAEGGSSAEIDPFTGLHTKEALMSRISNTIGELNMGNSQKANRLFIKAGDMNNFKQANDIKGHTGFNLFLQEELAHKFITLSKALNRPADHDDDIEHIEQTNSNLEYKGDVDGTTALALFGNQIGNVLLTKARERGISIDMYRAQPGGDEIFFAYEFTNDPTDDDMQIANDIVDYVFSQCILGRHTNTAELEIFKKAADRSPQDFPITTELVSEAEASFWANLAADLSQILRTAGITEGIVNDEQCVLRMSAATSKPHSLEEAIISFQNGTDFEGKQLMENGSNKVRTDVGLLDKDGNLDPKKVEAYDERTLASAANRIAARGLRNPEEVGILLTRAADDQVSGLLLELTMDELDYIAKPQDKIDLVYRFWTGDISEEMLTIFGESKETLRSEAAYAVGSLRAVDRLQKELAGQNTRLDLFRRVYDAYVAKLSSNNFQQPLRESIRAFQLARTNNQELTFVAYMQPLIEENPLLAFYFQKLLNKVTHPQVNLPDIPVPVIEFQDPKLLQQLVQKAA